jgi:hypothetical protein
MAAAYIYSRFDINLYQMTRWREFLPSDYLVTIMADRSAGGDLDVSTSITSAAVASSTSASGPVARNSAEPTLQSETREMSRQMETSPVREPPPKPTRAPTKVLSILTLPSPRHGDEGPASIDIRERTSSSAQLEDSKGTGSPMGDSIDIPQGQEVSDLVRRLSHALLARQLPAQTLHRYALEPGDDDANLRSMSASCCRESWGSERRPVKEVNVDVEVAQGEQEAEGEEGPELALLRRRIAVLEVDARLSAAERLEAERDLQRNEARWAAEITALSVRLSGAERELREAQDAARRMRMELATRDAEVASLEVSWRDAEQAVEGAAEGARRESVDTVLAQSRLVSLLDRQRSSGESLVRGLEEELEATRAAHRAAAAEALDWRTKAQQKGSGFQDDSMLSEAATREVADERLEAYFRAAPQSIPRPSRVSRVTPLALSAALQRDLEETQRRLDLLQARNRIDIDLPPSRSRAPARLASKTPSYSRYSSALPVRNSGVHAPLSLPKYPASSYSPTVLAAARARPPKSEHLREWFQVNADKGFLRHSHAPIPIYL